MSLVLLAMALKGWTFDWESAGIGAVAAVIACVVSVAIYLAHRPPPAPEVDAVDPEDQALESDGELFAADERAALERETRSHLQRKLGAGLFATSDPDVVEVVPLIRFQAPELHVYRRVEWEEPMACAGDTCNSEPFVDGQEFYEIPVTDPETGEAQAILICVGCAAASVPG